MAGGSVKGNHFECRYASWTDLNHPRASSRIVFGDSKFARSIYKEPRSVSIWSLNQELRENKKKTKNVDFCLPTKRFILNFKRVCKTTATIPMSSCREILSRAMCWKNLLVLSWVRAVHICLPMDHTFIELPKSALRTNEWEKWASYCRLVALKILYACVIKNVDTNNCCMSNDKGFWKLLSAYKEIKFKVDMAEKRSSTKI